MQNLNTVGMTKRWISQIYLIQPLQSQFFLIPDLVSCSEAYKKKDTVPKPE